MTGSNFRTLKEVDGIEYIFNWDEFKKWYRLIGRKKHGAKKNLKEQLSEELNVTVDAIERWIQRSNGPGDLGIVEKMERFFNAPAGSLLTPRTKPTEKEELEENVMREIKDYERDVARKLYAEMCDMVDGLEYFSEEDIQATAGLIGAGTPQGFKYLGKEPLPFQYRDHLIQNVRKVGFDLPKRTRDQLMDFIFEAFGDDCSDTGMMYFESQAYKDYLEKTETENNDDARVLYSVSYIKQLYEKLDAIFADYLRE